MIRVELARPWLVAHLPRPMRVLSWAPFRPGFTTASRVVWREVKNADLTPELDVEAWYAAEMARWPEAVGMLTSRDIGTYSFAEASVDGVRAACLATVGLSNAESVGRRRPYHTADWGTINTCTVLDAALSEAAQLESLAVAVQARTAAVMALDLRLDTGIATGTGTDCTALACDAGDGKYAGLHTAIGEAVGAATRQAVAAAGADWVVWRDAERARRAAR
ncbi:MAG: adenosylcobinamide amidohydrolase [Rhodobacter sp. CACIA14H1]|nr:MAG: adenosylcobinamide amidohydrolase [Rhodobacter sp. CACIA14H1]